MDLNNYKEVVSLDRLKEFQLEILKDIDKFCKNHDIKYSLAYGTLLGAVRHNGFIPWDDDIDIWMSREDYDTFMKIYKSDRYKQIYQYDGINLPYGKVYDNETIVIENVNNSISKGLFVDIFPLDYISSDKSIRMSQFAKNNRLFSFKIIKDVRLDKNKTILRNLKLALLKLFLLPISYKKVLEKLYNLSQQSKNDKNNITDFNSLSHPLILKPSIWKNLKTLQFEDSRFPVFSDFDDVLHMIYDDYMQLPPIEQRITHHGFKAFEPVGKFN